MPFAEYAASSETYLIRNPVNRRVQAVTHGLSDGPISITYIFAVYNQFELVNAQNLHQQWPLCKSLQFVVMSAHCTVFFSFPSRVMGNISTPSAENGLVNQLKEGQIFVFAPANAPALVHSLSCGRRWKSAETVLSG